MSFHLLTYQGTVNGSSALTQVNAIADAAMPTQNSKYTLPADYMALFGYAQGATINRCVLDSPTLNTNYSPQIRPVSVASAVPNDPAIWVGLEGPMTLPRYEGIAAKVANGGSEVTYVGIGATQQIVPHGKGPIKILRGTGTTTVTANSYTTCAITFDQTLQPGVYQCCSAEFISATGIFGRLIFSGTTQTERPGSICSTVVGNRPDYFFYARYAMGVWGTFRPEIGMPQVEFMCSVADTAQTVFLYLIQVGV